MIFEESQRSPESTALDEILQNLVNGVRDVFPQVRAVVLGGSYGRGEGIAAVSGNIVNDLDVTLVFSKPPSYFARSRLRRLSRQLEQDLHLPHVDLMFETVESLHRNPLTMARFDLLSSGRVLWGDISLGIDAVDSSKPFPEAEIANLLINRSITLLEACPEVNNGLASSQKMRQLSKVFWALIDAAMYERGQFKTLYKDKAEFASSGNPSVEAYRPILSTMTKAWSLALLPHECSEQILVDSWETIRKHFLIEITKWAPSPGLHNPRSLTVSKRVIFGVAALLRARAIKWRVEEEILKLLVNGRAQSDFALEAEKLVSRWYRS